MKLLLTRPRGRDAARGGTAAAGEFAGQIAADADDMYESKVDGSIITTSPVSMGGNVASGFTPYLTAFRFQNVTINQGATVPYAHMRFVASNGNGAGCVLRIRAEASGNAPALTTTASNISSRTLTTAYVDWDVGPWVVNQDDVSTISPNIASILDEVFARGDWVAGGSVVLVIDLSPTNTDDEAPRRRATGYGSDPAKAARLAINTTEETAPAAPVSLEMRGDASFALASIDDTITDDEGVTARTWYSRLLASMAQRGGSSMDGSDFGYDSNRPWGRTGNMGCTEALIAFRYTGDLALLDEVVRLTEKAWAAKGGGDGTYTWWTGYDNDLDVPLAAGLIACVAWATHHNRDLTSPAGHDYGAIADKYKAWLLSSFVTRWQGLKSREGLLPPIRKGQGHTWVNTMRVMWYLGRLGGGAGHTAQEYFDAVTAMITEKLGQDRLCTDGMTGGRSGRVWMHSVTATVGGTGTSSCLQYTTYTRYEFPAYLDLTLEGADARLDAAFWQSVAAGYADRVLDGDPEGTGDAGAGTIGGDLLSRVSDVCSGSYHQPGDPIPDRCGILYHHCFRGRNAAARLLEYGSAMFLAGWDSLDKIGPYLHPYYPTVGTVAAPLRPGYVAGRFFTMMYHGAED